MKKICSVVFIVGLLLGTIPPVQATESKQNRLIRLMREHPYATAALCTSAAAVSIAAILVYQTQKKATFDGKGNNYPWYFPWFLRKSVGKIPVIKKDDDSDECEQGPSFADRTPITSSDGTRSVVPRSSDSTDHFKRRSSRPARRFSAPEVTVLGDEKPRSHDEDGDQDNSKNNAEEEQGYSERSSDSEDDSETSKHRRKTTTRGHSAKKLSRTQSGSSTYHSDEKKPTPPQSPKSSGHTFLKDKGKGIFNHEQHPATSTHSISKKTGDSNSSESKEEDSTKSFIEISKQDDYTIGWLLVPAYSDHVLVRFYESNLNPILISPTTLKASPPNGLAVWKSTLSKEQENILRGSLNGEIDKNALKRVLWPFKKEPRSRAFTCVEGKYQDDRANQWNSKLRHAPLVLASLKSPDTRGDNTNQENNNEQLVEQIKIIFQATIQLIRDQKARFSNITKYNATVPHNEPENKIGMTSITLGKEIVAEPLKFISEFFKKIQDVNLKKTTPASIVQSYNNGTMSKNYTILQPIHKTLQGDIVKINTLLDTLEKEKKAREEAKRTEELCEKIQAAASDQTRNQPVHSDFQNVSTASLSSASTNSLPSLSTINPFTSPFPPKETIPSYPPSFTAPSTTWIRSAAASGVVQSTQSALNNTQQQPVVTHPQEPLSHGTRTNHFFNRAHSSTSASASSASTSKNNNNTSTLHNSSASTTSQSPIDPFRSPFPPKETIFSHPSSFTGPSTAGTSPAAFSGATQSTQSSANNSQTSSASASTSALKTNNTAGNIDYLRSFPSISSYPSSFTGPSTTRTSLATVSGVTQSTNPALTTNNTVSNIDPSKSPFASTSEPTSLRGFRVAHSSSTTGPSTTWTAPATWAGVVRTTSSNPNDSKLVGSQLSPTTSQSPGAGSTSKLHNNGSSNVSTSGMLGAHGTNEQKQISEIRSKTELQKIDYQGNNLLHLAVLKNKGIVKALVEQMDTFGITKSMIAQKNRYHQTPLMAAVINKAPHDTIEQYANLYLKLSCAKDFGAENDFGNNIFHLAVLNNKDLETCKILIKQATKFRHKKDKKSSLATIMLESVNCSEQTPLMMALNQNPALPDDILLLYIANTRITNENKEQYAKATVSETIKKAIYKKAAEQSVASESNGSTGSFMPGKEYLNQKDKPALADSKTKDLKTTTYDALQPLRNMANDEQKLKIMRKMAISLANAKIQYETEIIPLINEVNELYAKNGYGYDVYIHEIPDTNNYKSRASTDLNYDMESIPRTNSKRQDINDIVATMLACNDKPWQFWETFEGDILKACSYITENLSKIKADLSPKQLATDTSNNHHTGTKKEENNQTTKQHTKNNTSHNGLTTRTAQNNQTNQSDNDDLSIGLKGTRLADMSDDEEVGNTTPRSSNDKKQSTQNAPQTNSSTVSESSKSSFSNVLKERLKEKAASRDKSESDKTSTTNIGKTLQKHFAEHNNTLQPAKTQSPSTEPPVTQKAIPVDPAASKQIPLPPTPPTPGILQPQPNTPHPASTNSAQQPQGPTTKMLQEQIKRLNQTNTSAPGSSVSLGTQPDAPKEEDTNKNSGKVITSLLERLRKEGSIPSHVTQQSKAHNNQGDDDDYTFDDDSTYKAASAKENDATLAMEKAQQKKQEETHEHQQSSVAVHFSADDLARLSRIRAGVDDYDDYDNRSDVE